MCAWRGKSSLNTEMEVLVKLHAGYGEVKYGREGKELKHTRTTTEKKGELGLQFTPPDAIYAPF